MATIIAETDDLGGSAHRHDVGAAALQVLTEPNVVRKAALTRELVARIFSADRAKWMLPTAETASRLPSEPSRPPSAPHSEHKCKGSSLRTTLHGIAHAEGYAVDLMWDIVARYAGSLPPSEATAFTADWLAIAAEEAVHFDRWNGQLKDVFGIEYGELPTHSGLWEAAAATTDDVLDRLALVHMVHEARGLDTSAASLARIVAYETSAGHRAPEGGPCAATLRTNVKDEIGHVAAAVRWFERVCTLRGITDPHAKFKEIVRSKFRGQLKPPFDLEKRQQASMSTAYFLWATEEDEGGDNGEGSVDVNRTEQSAAKARRQALNAIERDLRALRSTVNAQQTRVDRVWHRVRALENRT